MSALIAGANEAANRLAEKFSKTDVLALLVILVTIGGSVGGLGLYVGSAFGGVNERLRSLEQFKQSGSRCTAADCAAITSRVDILERAALNLSDRVDDLPPKWFQEQVGDLRQVTGELRSQMMELTVQMANLAKSPERWHYSPNDLMRPGIDIGK